MPSGVYVIVNKVNNKQYVGSAVDLYQRRTLHFSKLRCARHPSKHLQAAFNKYGEDSFSFGVLEEVSDVTRESLLACEQKWIDLLRPAYNKRITADCNLGVPMSEEQKRRNSDAMRAWRATPAGEAHAAALAARAKAMWADPVRRAERLAKIKAVWTPEKRAAQSEYNKLNRRHILDDGTHFGGHRIWTEEEKLRSGAKMRKAWESRKPVTEDDIRELVKATNPAWTAKAMDGVRTTNKVLIHCSLHDHEQWQSIAKLRHSARGCKLCGYQRSSEVQAGRPKPQPSLSS